MILNEWKSKYTAEIRYLSQNSIKRIIKKLQISEARHSSREDNTAVLVSSKGFVSPQWKEAVRERLSESLSLQ